MTEEVKKAALKLQQDEKEVKVRKKLYRSGKLWLAASLATAVFGATVVSGGVTANADTVDTSAPTTTTTTSTTSSQGNTATLKMTASTTASSTTDAQSAPAVNETAKQATAPSQPVETASTAEATQGTTAQATTDSATASSSAANANQAEQNESASTTEKVTNLGVASDAQATSAKQAAATDYAKTGQSQKVTRVAATTPATIVKSGTYGTATWDIDSNGLLTIHAGVFSGQNNSYKNDATLVKSVYVEPGVSADSTVHGVDLFAVLNNVVSIDASNLDVSQMTTLAGAFTQDENLESVNVSGWNTSNVTTLQNMFNYDSALKTVDLSSFDTAKVTNTASMFSETGLTSLDLSNFDMTNVTDASNMFMSDKHLAQLSLSSTANLKASGLPNTNSQVITLPDGSSTNTVNGWQAVGSGTVAAPTGAVLKSADLMTLYDGTGTAPVETYVWSPSVANSVTVIDAYTGKAVVNQDIDGLYGTDANFTSLIPKDYHLASGDELGSYTQPTSTKIGTTGTHFDVYVAPNTVDTINFVDDDNNGAIVQTDKIGGTSGDVSDYTTSDDVAALTDKGYEIVSSDVPSSITYDTTESTYTVHVKHIIKTVKGTDADADKGTQVKPLTVNFIGDPSGTELTAVDVAPTGDLSQDLVYYRDAVEDEALKAAGAANYAKLGDWYTGDSLTPVEVAEVPGYSANFAGPITMDSVFELPQGDEVKMSDLMKNSVAGTDDHTSTTLNIHIRYTANTYGTQIQYVDQNTGEQVGTTETVSGTYKTQLTYGAVAPTGYEVVPDQAGLTNNKIIFTYLPDMDPVTIYVTPIVTLQSATVTYQDEDGTQLGVETLTGNSDTAIPFDTASYIAAKFAHYDLVSDETTTPATFDEDSTSAQNFNVVLRLQNVTTPVTPVDSAGNPIPGTTPTQEAGHPGQPITDFPTVDGYVLVPNQAVYFPANDGDVTNVYYLPGTQEATVHFTDQNGKSLGTLEVAGESGAEIEHHNIDTVTLQIINQGYSLKSDDTVGATFDNDSSANQDFNVVLNKLDTPSTDTITKTVHYVDPEGNSLAPDYVSSVEIQQTLDSDTNKPNADTTAVLGHQADPTITGYKVLIDSAGATTDQTVNFGDTDMTYTVVYISDDVTTPNNGGGTTTPGNNGGTTTTTPGNNGGTSTTTPGNDGSTTTTPGNNGGTTTTTTPGNNGGTTITTPSNNGDTTTTTPTPTNGGGVTTPVDTGTITPTTNGNVTVTTGTNGDDLTPEITSTTTGNDTTPVTTGQLDGDNTHVTNDETTQGATVDQKHSDSTATVTALDTSKAKSTSTKQAATVLPQTNEAASSLMVVAGMMLLASLGLVGLAGKKKQD